MDNCVENPLALSHIFRAAQCACTSTTKRKHIKQPAKLVPVRQATTRIRELNCWESNQRFCAAFYNENH